MIRYHSFYAAHREGAYAHLMNDADRRRMEWVRAFNPYDLYSKGHEPPGRRGAAPVLRRLDRRILPGQARTGDHEARELALPETRLEDSGHATMIFHSIFIDC